MRNLYIIILLIVLVACGGDEPSGGGSSLSLEVTIPAVQPRTLVDGCPREELEDWFEVTYFPLRDFVERSQIKSRTARDDRRNEIDVVLDELVAVRDRINSAVTPDCVQTRHLVIVNDMQAIIEDFQLFANAEISAEELETQVAAHIQALRGYIDTLEEEVAPLYQLEPTNP